MTSDWALGTGEEHGDGSFWRNKQFSHDCSSVHCPRIPLQEPTSQQMPVRTHKDLIVWQKAVRLASKIYRATEHFPNRERHVLAVQMRRSAVSIASNIAEGAARNSRPEYIRFLNIARGSMAELETQVHICFDLAVIKSGDGLAEDVAEVGRLLSALHRKLSEHRDRAKSFAPPHPPVPSH
ncbi:MAG: four helix bundle protein [Steroidobacteraceae bacterium]